LPTPLRILCHLTSANRLDTAAPLSEAEWMVTACGAR
jgi:hypothetical protein